MVNVIYGICCRPYAMISSFFSRIVRSSKRSLHQHNMLVAELKNALMRFEELKKPTVILNFYLIQKGDQINIFSLVSSFSERFPLRKSSY